MQEDLILREQFKILKEISSLLDKNHQLQQSLNNERHRVVKIESLRESRQNELQASQEKLKNLMSEENQIENKLAHLQSQLDQAKGHLNQLQTQQQIDALNKEINNSEEKIALLEEDGMLILEKIDSLESSINDTVTFLEGSLESLLEITKEVDKESEELENQIRNLDHRIDSLMQELNPIFQNKLKTALSKKIPMSLFTRVSSGHCDFCKLALNRLDIENIEKKLTLTTCNGCHRIFIPVSSLY